MTRIGKLYDRARAGRGLSFAESCRLLTAFGYEHQRTSGSHQVYRHSVIADKRVIQPKGKDAKAYQVEQFLDMVEKHALTLRDGE